MSYQTVKLEGGPHDEGTGKACVMEIVSMLAHERFSDHPDCTCPVIAGVLQAINDFATDVQRQQLWPYTTRVVNTNDGKYLERLHELSKTLGYGNDSPSLKKWCEQGSAMEDKGLYLAAASSYTVALCLKIGWNRTLDLLDSLLPETEEIPAEELIAVKRELAAA